LKSSNSQIELPSLYWAIAFAVVTLLLVSYGIYTYLDPNSTSSGAEEGRVCFSINQIDDYNFKQKMRKILKTGNSGWTGAIPKSSLTTCIDSNWTFKNCISIGKSDMDECAKYFLEKCCPGKISLGYCCY
jgi:hypothetical protein